VKTALLLTVLGGLLATAIAWAAYVWLSLGDVEISLNGMIALGVGALLTLVLGVGLMALVFISSRRGHDDLV
jgi:hypothetical protein